MKFKEITNNNIGIIDKVLVFKNIILEILISKTLPEYVIGQLKVQGRYDWKNRVGEGRTITYFTKIGAKF